MSFSRIVSMSAAVALGWLVTTSAVFAEDPTVEQTQAALRKSVGFFHGQVAAHGGYVYQYSHDLARREGEGATDKDTVWVQPPGTPAVGLAYVEAFERIGDPALLAAAKDAADCLIRGQFRSGGWNSSIDFAPERRAKTAYRVDPPRPKKPGFNVSTFDDDKSQSALRFLMRLDQALKFEDKRLHECVQFALDAVLAAQFPSGGWAQGFQGPIDPNLAPVKKASYPESWSKTYAKSDYWWFPTLNDNTMADIIATLFLAESIYKAPRYRASALKAGEFLLLAQMPDPQPAWAQQYDFEMRPVWARKFEPPAISGGESQGVIKILLTLYEQTGERKFLEPIPRAIAYLRDSTLPDGRLARFYELKTNTPLYFTREYVLTTKDDDLPTHYGFKVSNRLDSLKREYDELARLSPEQLQARREKPGSRNDSAKALAPTVRAVIAALDERGAWVEDGTLRYHGKGDPTRRVIRSVTFIKNLNLLSRYLQASRASAPASP